MVVTSALMIAALSAGVAPAGAAPPPGSVSFSVPSLSPSFAPDIEDYVVRCQNAPVTVQGHASAGWQMAIANNPFRSGDFSQTVPLSSGRAFVVAVRQGGPPVYRYHVRCLPNSFPTYTFTRSGPVSPKYFAVTLATTFATRSSSTITGCRSGGFVLPTWNAQVLPDGNVLWFNPLAGPFEIHRLDGSLIRVLRPVGHPADGHDLQLLPNGDHLSALTSNRTTSTRAPTAARATPPSTSRATGGELERPAGLGLEDPGPHRPGRDRTLVAEGDRLGYDLVHWNSIQPAGNGSVIASFRHLDAVYKIDQSTGAIVWKLGGTSRPESLNVIGDPRPYTFGGQHDARLFRDGTLTVFDNRTDLGSPPRAVRFRIDENAGTATLLQSISDPDVPTLRLLWLGTASGQRGLADRLGAGHEPSDRRLRAQWPETFLLTFDARSSYRAEPVPAGAVSAQSLRQAMNAMVLVGLQLTLRRVAGPRARGDGRWAAAERDYSSAA